MARQLGKPTLHWHSCTALSSDDSIEVWNVISFLLPVRSMMQFDREGVGLVFGSQGASCAGLNGSSIRVGVQV